MALSLIWAGYKNDHEFSSLRMSFADLRLILNDACLAVMLANVTVADF